MCIYVYVTIIWIVPKYVGHVYAYAHACVYIYLRTKPRFNIMTYKTPYNSGVL